MKRSMLLVWAVLAALVLPAFAQDDKVAEEDKKFEGTWIVVSLSVGDRKVEGDEIGDQTFTFKGKNYEQKEGEKLIEAGKQDLNPSKKPMHMDITVTEGETKGKKQLAIYEWDGNDKVTICAAAHDDPTRPEKIEAKEGSKNMVFVLKRKK